MNDTALLYAAQHALDSLLKLSGAITLDFDANGVARNTEHIHMTVSKDIHAEARTRIAELRAAIHPIIYAVAVKGTN